MDRIVTIEAPTTVLDDAGTPTTTWAPIGPALRAALSRNRVAEIDDALGPVTDARLTFATWWVDGITLDHRLIYDGQAYEIRDLAEVGRGRGLTITARRIGP